jgi:hypothetical protein
MICPGVTANGEVKVAPLPPKPPPPSAPAAVIFTLNTQGGTVKLAGAPVQLNVVVVCAIQFADVKIVATNNENSCRISLREYFIIN